MSLAVCKHQTHAEAIEGLKKHGGTLVDLGRIKDTPWCWQLQDEALKVLYAADADVSRDTRRALSPGALYTLTLQVAGWKEELDHSVQARKQQCECIERPSPSYCQPTKDAQRH